MLRFPNDWFEWTILLSVFGALLWGGAAAYYAFKHSYPREVKAAGFTGTVKEFSKIAVTTGAAGLVTGVLSKDLKDFPFFQQAAMSSSKAGSLLLDPGTGKQVNLAFPGY